MLIEHTIKINTPKPVVWKVTTDVKQWPEWTPTVNTVNLVDDGPLRSGSRVLIKQPGQPEAEWTVTEFVPEESFTWESRRAGLTFSASHNIVSHGTHSESVLRLKATGILSVLLFPLLRPAINRALAEENKALKAKCEGLSEAASGS